MSKRARPNLKIAVLGAGNIGTALAQALARNGHEITVWDFFPDVVEDIQTRRENRRFLPGIALPTGIHATNSPVECVHGASLIAVCVPSHFVKTTLTAALPALQSGAILLNLAKGFASRSRMPLPFLLERLAPGHSCVHLAGPAIANEIARGQTASIVLASSSKESAKQVAGWCAGTAFLPGCTTDVAGAALGGILKNIYAILLGSVATLSADSRNLEASVVTASVREMAAIAAAHGGQSTTLYGLAGMGDLIATGFSQDSHNRRFGQMLASGRNVAGIEKEIGWLPEGARACATVCAMARAGGVAAPLAGWVRRTLGGSPPSLDGILRALHSAARTLPE